MTRLLPIVSSRGGPFSGQRWFGFGSSWLKMVAKIAPSSAASETAPATRFPAIRLSVRPVAVRWATIKAISTSVHNTTRRAKPPLRRQAADCVHCRRDNCLQTVRIGQTRNTRPLQLLRDEASADQLAAQIFGQRAGIALIMHDVRRDQHEQLGAHS